jgi:lipopolysaccharide export system permease protein
MKKKLTPKTIIAYLIKEFNFSLLIFFSIFISLILLTTFLEEIIFFKDKNISGNLYIRVLSLTLIRTPTILFNMLPFIFLFSGIFFFAKLLKNNEIMPLNLSGVSKNFTTLIPAIYSLLLGIAIIFLFTPISAELSKYYESYKRQYSNNENLIVMSDNGLWVKEKTNTNIKIFKADTIRDNNFNQLKNLVIFKFDQTNNFVERIESKSAFINARGVWLLQNVKKINYLNKDEISLYDELKYETQISLDELKNYFINANVYSIWNINQELKKLNEKGYYGQELIITFNKYLSLPLLLFSMIMISTIFTLHNGYNFNNFIYAFFGVMSGIIIYFLSDLSIALGKNGKLPLSLSVWVPIFIILTLSCFGILKRND